MFENGYMKIKNQRFGIDNTKQYFFKYFSICTLYLFPLVLFELLGISIPLFFTFIAFLMVIISFILVISISKINYWYCTKDENLIYQYINSYNKKSEIQEMIKCEDNSWILHIKNSKKSIKMFLLKDEDWYMIKMQYPKNEEEVDIWQKDLK